MPRERGGEGGVARCPPVEPAVEGGEKSAPGRLPVSQQQGAERRGERQGVERGDDHRYGDRHRKLLEQPPRDAAREGDGNEDGQQHDGRGYDRRSDVAHRFGGRFAGFHAGGDIHLHGLDHDDRVVHHQSDGEYQSQQRDDVDRESQQREEREGSDERYGNGHQRDDRGTPVLDEEVDDGDDEHEGDDERAEDVPHAGVDALRAVHDRRGFDAVGETLREPRHGGLDLVAHGHGVAARLLVDDDERRGAALEPRADAVAPAAERYFGQVAQPDLLSRGGGPHEYPAELLGRGDLRRQRHRVGVGRSFGGRFGSELPGRVDACLPFDGLGHLFDRDAVVFQHVGPQPDAHGVFARTHDIDLAHAVELEQFVLQVDVGVVGEVFVVVTAVAVQRVNHQEAGHGLACGDTLSGYRRGQLGRGRSDVVLGEDGVHVGIGADLEGHLQRHGAVVGRCGLHVEHVVHAHDGLRHGGGHGVVHRFGVGAVVGRRDLDHRGRDVGVLLDRQSAERDESRDDDDDCQRQGEDRPRDEESFHGAIGFRG